MGFGIGIGIGIGNTYDLVLVLLRSRCSDMNVSVSVSVKILVSVDHYFRRSFLFKTRTYILMKGSVIDNTKTFKIYKIRINSIYFFTNE
jgi:hypothetical protein